MMLETISNGIEETAVKSSSKKCDEQNSISRSQLSFIENRMLIRFKTVKLLTLL
jgi:hypothetical protein